MELIKNANEESKAAWIEALRPICKPENAGDLNAAMLLYSPWLKPYFRVPILTPVISSNPRNTLNIVNCFRTGIQEVPHVDCVDIDSKTGQDTRRAIVQSSLTTTVALYNIPPENLRDDHVECRRDGGVTDNGLFIPISRFSIGADIVEIRTPGNNSPYVGTSFSAASRLTRGVFAAWQEFLRNDLRSVEFAKGWSKAECGGVYADFKNVAINEHENDTFAGTSKPLRMCLATAWLLRKFGLSLPITEMRAALFDSHIKNTYYEHEELKKAEQRPNDYKLQGRAARIKRRRDNVR